MKLSQDFVKLANTSQFIVLNRFLVLNDYKNISEEDIEEFFKINYDIFYGRNLNIEKFNGQFYIKSKDETSELRIYIKTTEIDHYDIIEEFIIPKFKNIPNLYGYFIKEDISLSYITKEIMSYNFLVEPLGILAPAGYDHDFIKETENLIERNKEKLNGIKRVISGRPQFLGTGVDGVAFKINNGMVLKFFRNKWAYDSARYALERLHKQPKLAKTEAMIYDSGNLGEFYGNNLYYYIIEKMTPIVMNTIGENNYDVLKYIITFIKEYSLKFEATLKHYYKQYYNYKKEDNIQRLLEKFANKVEEKVKQEIPSEYDIVNKIPNLNKNWLKLLTLEIVTKLSSNRYDLHIGNLGITNNGEFRYFDPAYQDPNYKSNDSE